MTDAEYFIAKADELFRLARRAAGDAELARDIEALANELMVKAVELDTRRDKAASK
jgi:hypothetical protein